MPAAAVPSLPAALREDGDAVRAITQAVATRVTGVLTLGPQGEARRILLREGDIITAVGELESETLVAFLVNRGDLGEMRRPGCKASSRHSVGTRAPP